MVGDPYQPHYDAIKQLFSEIATDQEAMTRANYAHQQITARGYAVGSPEWYQTIKWSRGGIDTKPELTQAERDLAKQLKLDEDVYAAEKGRLNEYKAAGFYRRDRG